jgi:hypothetical protein
MVHQQERQNTLYIVDYIAAVNNLMNTVVSARLKFDPALKYLSVT